MAESIVLAGSLAQRPGHGGHTWVFLQYLLGLRRLGWDVLFLDEIQPGMCVDEEGTSCPCEQSWNVRYFVEVMQRFGLAQDLRHGQSAYSLRMTGSDSARGDQVVGLSRAKVLDRVKGSAGLINVMGYLSDAEILAAAPRKIFLDIDPGFGQMWRALGLANIFAGHDDFVTIGENVGLPGCEVPTCGLSWITTPQPVVLEHWPVARDESGTYSSVATWRGRYGPIDYRGKRYGLRVHEFRKFVTLPQRTGRAFHLAMNIDAKETADLTLLLENDWVLDSPRTAARDPWAYRHYVQRSRAEFMVAKNLYVETRGGWFSDRSICYLASGKPVIAQDTGVKHLYPSECGLLLYSTLDEATASVNAVEADYSRHSQAARAVAEEYFDSDRVLPKLLSKLGLG
jgi:hypothetical protein